MSRKSAPRPAGRACPLDSLFSIRLIEFSIRLIVSKAMGTGRDLNRTRERIMSAGLAEFSAHGFAGARTGAISRRAGVNQRMIFYCFKTKEGLYREVLRRKLADRASMFESSPDDDFAGRLVKGYETNCRNLDHVRMSEWEALAGGTRRLVAEDERRALLRIEAAQLRRARSRGELPADADDQMLLMVSIALRLVPLAFPQITRLVSGVAPDDPKFRRKWGKCLRWVGKRIATSANGAASEPKKVDRVMKRSSLSVESWLMPSGNRAARGAGPRPE